jgi:Ankyrin repeats (3 copies)
MTMKKQLPPYPRFGECVSALAGAMDTNKTGSDVGRLTREGDFDWERLDKVIDELLVDGSAAVVGDTAHRIFVRWVSSVRSAYTRLVLGVSLDALGRSEALPVLVAHFFAPAGGQLLRQVSSELPGPDLHRLLDDGQQPLQVTLKWLDSVVGGPVEKLLYPGSTGSARVEQEKVRKWRSGTDIPSAQSIKLLYRKLVECWKPIPACPVWLLIASALSRLERQWTGSFRSLMLPQAQGIASPSRPVEDVLSELVVGAGQAWPELAEAGCHLWHDLRRTSIKQLGDRGRVWQQIEALEQLAKRRDPEGHTAYHYSWMKGRWHVLSGQYQEALPHYKQAFEQACYRAGHQIKDIVSEASCLSAFLPKERVFLKQLKHVGIALGLYCRPDAGTVVEDWELDQLALQLPVEFPACGRFVECQQDLADEPIQGLLVLDRDVISKMKPDLKAPCRVRAVHSADGQVRRWPQLRLFASFGLLEQVQALLDAGASVDDLDSSDASALLCAVQHAEQTGRREVLDLLLVQVHQRATINAMTKRKRLTPLMCAIDLGLPDVVATLVAQGADVEQRALTDNQAPLYYLVSQLSGKVNPSQMLVRQTALMMQEPDLVLQDTLRRFGVGLAGAFGSNTTALRSHQELAIAVAKALVDMHVSRHSIPRLMRIAATLLEAGARPNATHRYPVPGRTPLMLAAESDLSELMDLMIQRGGDPLMPDAQGQNCWQIARAFHSRRVLNYLSQRYR